MGSGPRHFLRIGIGLLLLLQASTGFSQKVGLVLSGGGASGLCHIGVIRALEEHQIPIDYVCGTSMGALIGAMYASGYSTEEMTQLFTSERFLKMSRGEIEDKYLYYFKQKPENASWISLKFNRDTAWRASLPTNLISPVALDLEMMERLSAPGAAAANDFNRLMIPFRCVAADIHAKEEYVVDSGSLSEAVRASMSYPLFLKPIMVDGRLLMDGGLYNNFPADVMEQEFQPDILLGSNVSSQLEAPTEDNLILQIKNLLIRREEVPLSPDSSFVLTPDVVDISVFDFSNPQAIIDSGYVTTLRKIEQIEQLVNRRIPAEALQKKRETFRKSFPPLVFQNIEIEGLNRAQSRYVEKVLRPRRDREKNIQNLRSSYFRVFGDDKIKSIYPKAVFNPDSLIYNLHLKVKRERDLIADFGGNFSSRPINTAFIGLQYNYLSDYGISLMANSYFGKLYGSGQLKARFDFPVRLPFYVEGEFTLNRWNYFRSRATFFEDVKPSYLVHNESFGGINIGFPLGAQGRAKAGYSRIQTRDDYYQTRDFISTDTTDVTIFQGNSIFMQYERSSLNDKQYPTQGKYLSIKARLTEGEEEYEPGSTSPVDRNLSSLHEWAQIKVNYDNYYKTRGRVYLGFMLEGVYSSQELFNNYTAAVAQAPSFQPTPESKTLFLETFRAYQYLAGGHKVIFNLFPNLDFRLEGYLFQPYQELLRNEDSREAFSANEIFDRRFTIASGNLVYRSPIGPVSAGVNYYHNSPEVTLESETPLTFLFHFGYVIFNNRALE
ncbi:MAG: patatin-like phospholipase family protein [Salibacteraceae bacterium]